jgi:hypothetical protein
MINQSTPKLLTLLTAAAITVAATASSHAGIVLFDPNNSTITGGTTNQTLTQTDAGDTGLDVDLNLTAVGGTDNTFSVAANGIGVNGLGNQSIPARVDKVNNESILLSFDQIVDLLSIEFGAFNEGQNETVRLRFVSGTNPFASITIDSNDDTANLALVATGAFGTVFDALDISNTQAAKGANLVEFNVGTNDLITIAAGTVLEMTEHVAVDGVQLRDITVDVKQIPEPASLASGLLGLTLIALRRRR